MGPSTQYLRLLVPKAIPSMVFGTRVLKYWVLGPSKIAWTSTAQRPYSKAFRLKGPQTTGSSSTPQLPFKTPQIPSNSDHKTLDRGTLGVLDWYPKAWNLEVLWMPLSCLWVPAEACTLDIQRLLGLFTSSKRALEPKHLLTEALGCLPEGSEASYFSVSGPKDHIIQRFWAILSLRVRGRDSPDNSPRIELERRQRDPQVPHPQDPSTHIGLVP